MTEELSAFGDFFVAFVGALIILIKYWKFPQFNDWFAVDVIILFGVGIFIKSGFDILRRGK